MGTRGPKPGSPRVGGRQKGTPNKLTASVRMAVIDAFEKLGGVDYLVKIGTEEPKTFITLLAKILPTQVEGAGDGRQHLMVSWLSEVDGRLAASRPTSRAQPNCSYFRFRGDVVASADRKQTCTISECFGIECVSRFPTLTTILSVLCVKTASRFIPQAAIDNVSADGENATCDHV